MKQTHDVNHYYHQMYGIPGRPDRNRHTHPNPVRPHSGNGRQTGRSPQKWPQSGYPQVHPQHPVRNVMYSVWTLVTSVLFYATFVLACLRLWLPMVGTLTLCLPLPLYGLTCFVRESRKNRRQSERSI